MKRRAAIGAAGLLAAAALLVVFWPRQAAQRPDENGMYTAQGHWVQTVGETDADSAARFAQKLADLGQTCLTGENRVFWAIVPDKGYYLPGAADPATDYDALFETVRRGLAGSGMTEIDLTSALSLEDYYHTDSHWRQERLQPVLDALGAQMGFAVQADAFSPIEHAGFVGAYGKYGADAPEPLYYLTSPATRNAWVENTQAPDTHVVYDTGRLATDVPYDVFLSGASPLITITSPEAATDRQLVIFRDSYASSLAPLLLEQYRTVTLVDLRYMASLLLPQYVEFTNQDVLFLYSTYVVNQSAMLR